ncbi:murein L,D-transpeptidase family protein [Albirhodobacter sp. R86504]|uniref:L,D-transpeptidase family protein n=1 Tax=Albirhodobacter sp. R86504 TaxID=3093848 RepID=UPI00366A8D29
MMRAYWRLAIGIVLAALSGVAFLYVIWGHSMMSPSSGSPNDATQVVTPPRVPIAVIPDAERQPDAGPLEAIPRDDMAAGDPGADATVSQPDALTETPNMDADLDAATTRLTADLKPMAKPLTLQPLETVSRILVEKSARRLTVYSGDQIARRWAIALGRSPIGDKSREGDNRTPEGTFRVDRLNGGSAYHLSLGLDYPHPKHRAAARALGVSAGGDIMIHGQPNRSPFEKLAGDWTAGCIALTDAEVTQLFAATEIGTIVEIRP